MFLLDANRKIVRATAGAKLLLGDMTAGRDLSLVIRAPKILEAVNDVLVGDRMRLIEFDIEFPAMTSVEAQIRLLEEPASDGSVLVVALFDVTEVKKLQQMRTDFVANASHELRAPLAVAVWHSDETLDIMYTSLFGEALTYMIEDPRSTSMCTHLLFIAKNIERIGDHVTNIAETIYFLVHGDRLRETRPKGGGDVETMNMPFSPDTEKDAKE